MLPAGQQTPVLVQAPSQHPSEQTTPGHDGVGIGVLVARRPSLVGMLGALVGFEFGVGGDAGSPRRAASTSSKTMAPTAATPPNPSNIFNALRREPDWLNTRVKASKREPSMLGFSQSERDARKWRCAGFQNAGGSVATCVSLHCFTGTAGVPWSLAAE